MLISVIIPNYNGQQLLKKNLPRVLEVLEAYRKKSDQNYEIIVVDDFSNDDSLEILNELEKQFTKLSVYKNDKNYGFSSTINNGVSKAKGDYLFLLNSDVVPEENFLEPLIRDFDDDQVFAVGCLDKSIEQGKVVERGRGKGKWARGFLVHSASTIKKAPSLWVSGGSGMFRKTLWDKFGGLRELYNPFYWEDIDLSYRAQKSGYKVMFEPESIVVHEHEKGAIKSTYSKNKIKEIAYKNQIIFVWLNADLSNLIKNALWIPYHLINTILRGDVMFALAFVKSLILFPKVLSERRRYSNLFIKSDYEVVSISN